MATCCSRNALAPYPPVSGISSTNSSEILLPNCSELFFLTTPCKEDGENNSTFDLITRAATDDTATRLSYTCFAQDMKSRGRLRLLCLPPPDSARDQNVHPIRSPPGPSLLSITRSYQHTHLHVRCSPPSPSTVCSASSLTSNSVSLVTINECAASLRARLSSYGLGNHQRVT